MSKAEYESSLAVGSLGGYVYQIMWALLALLKESDRNARVGIEVVDDITIENGKVIENQQAKKVADKNKSPFTNLNENLWKTFTIWISYAKEKDPECKTTSFTLVTNALTSEHLLVSFFKGEKTATRIEEFLEKVKGLDTESETVKAQIKKCLNKENIETFKLILARCQLKDASDGSGSVIEDIKNNAHIPDNVDTDKFVQQIIGLFLHDVQKKIENKEEIWLDKATLIQAHASAIISFTAGKVIGQEHFDKEADADYVEIASTTARYIKQLNCIEITKRDALIGAIHDYYRFHLTKDETVDSGEVLQKDWENDKKRLVDFWQMTNQTAELNAEVGAPRQKLGQKLYTICQQYSDLPKLCGNEREQFIVRGHYHDLADKEVIWWHPDYQDIKGGS